MKELMAKVEFGEVENALEILRAFYKESATDDILVVMNNEGIFNITSDTVPEQIVRALEKCNNYEYICGEERAKELWKSSWEKRIIKMREQTAAGEEKCNDESEDKEKCDHEVQNEEKLCDEAGDVENSATSKKHGKSNTVTNKKIKESSTTRRRKGEKCKVTENEQLKKIISENISLEDKVHKIAEWMKVGKWQSYFEGLIKGAVEIKKEQEEINWKNLRCKLDALKEKNDEKAEKTCRLYVSNKMKKIGCQTFILKVLDDVAEALVATKNTASTPEIDNAQKETPKENTHIKMQCMPESETLEKALSSIDKTQSVKERIEHVLTAMEQEIQKETEKDTILEIASKAVMLKPQLLAGDNFAEVWKNEIMEAKGNPTQSLRAKMVFSTFVNDFATKYDKDARIALKEFLVELQKAILTEEEMKNL